MTNRKPVDYAADKKTAWNLAEMYARMCRELGLNWAIGVDRIPHPAPGGHKIYEVYAVPRPRQPQDDSQSVPVARAHRRLASRSKRR